MYIFKLNFGDCNDSINVNNEKFYYIFLFKKKVLLFVPYFLLQKLHSFCYQFINKSKFAESSNELLQKSFGNAEKGLEELWQVFFCLASQRTFRIPYFSSSSSYSSSKIGTSYVASRA